MALAVSVIRTIWSTRPAKLLCIVCRLARIAVATEMIGGNCCAICGINVSTLLTSPSSVLMFSLNLSTPSIDSNTDFVAQQTGILRQCGSQYR